ncbi:serine/threonine-protein kinase STE20-like isoform X2 [Asterias rubens]|uniref:serine/threonine-protein kinase STE20-like isoform X2 n=1 Tax=Asterias rubens TaxID=7604 RepID=UPI001455B63A|nr:serine/threonine-protein kinase STE20-like isoform X2 [Asterias rubens]
MASSIVNSILLVLVVVVRMSWCNAQDSNSALQLLDFSVTKAEPPKYKVGKPTTITFRANIQNTGPTALSPSRSVCVIFFDISTGTENSRNVGQVNISYPVGLAPGQVHHLTRETVDITLTHEACPGGNTSGPRQLCAGVKSDGATTGTPYCLDFEEIDEGGAGEIDCGEVPIPPYVIGLPVGLVLLLVAMVVFFLVWKKCCRTTTNVESSRMADTRARLMSLPHIYVDPSTLTDEPAYDSTITKENGSQNTGYQVENEAENPYSTNLPVLEPGNKTPQLSDLMRKRPSQPNVYTIEEGIAHSAALESIPDSDSTQGDILEQFPSHTCLVVDTNDTIHQTDNLARGSVPGVSQHFEHDQDPEQDRNLNPIPEQETDAFTIIVPDVSSVIQESLKKPTPVPKPRNSMTGNNPDVSSEDHQAKTEEPIQYSDNPYLPPKPRVSARPKPSAKPRVPSLHIEIDKPNPQPPPRPARSSIGISPSKVDHVVLKEAVEEAVKGMNKRSVSDIKTPVHLRAEDIEPTAKTLDPSNPDFIDAVMQNYLSLMYEVSREEEEYQTQMKRELERIESNTLTVEPQMEYRRKSLSAQLTLNMSRKPNRDSDVYVNQWNKSWEFKRNFLDVDMTTPLGEGQFGKVYKGKATMFQGCICDLDVAVKVMKDDVGNDAKDEFLKELAIHTILKPNPHVVQLIGCCIRDDPIFIITEYLSGGNLLQYLRGRPSHLTGREFVQHYVAKFGLHIARGMAYVASMKIVHRDLAARNILISEHEVCKVADFGFARDIFGLAYYPKAPDRAPIRWYAPEAIMDDMFSTKSDVWSFGILLFEIATLGKRAPYHGMDNNQVRFSVSAARHPKRPVNCDNLLFQIMEKCWAKDPDDRPTFRELVIMFEGIQGNYPKPSETDLNPSDPNPRREVNTESRQKVNPYPRNIGAKPDLPPRLKINSVPEIKVNQESEVSSDPQHDDGSDSHHEVNSDRQSEVNSDPQFEVSSDPHSEVSSDPHHEVNSDPQFEVSSDPHSEVSSDPHHEVNSETYLEVNCDPQSEVRSDPYPEVKDNPSTANNNLQPDIIFGLKLEVDTIPSSELTSDRDSELNPDSDPEADPDSLAEIVTGDVSPDESEIDEEESF